MSIKSNAKMELPKLARFIVPGIDQYVKETIEEAARAWVKAALEIIPTWSGASRATLQQLAQAVNVPVPISPKSTAPNRIGLGRLYSSGGIRNPKRAVWDFYYESTLQYLIANETKNVKPRTEGLRGSLITPTPYKFRQAGDAAAKAVIDRRLNDLPLFAKLFVKRRIT